MKSRQVQSTAEAFLEECKGPRIWLSRSRMATYAAPKDRLTPGLLDRIRQLKFALVAYFRSGRLSYPSSKAARLFWDSPARPDLLRVRREVLPMPLQRKSPKTSKTRLKPPTSEMPHPPKAPQGATPKMPKGPT
jgi:hypothetical protein